ncbi:MAG TPA: cysteine--tRNA ligase [Bacteroidales bacterium]|nr:cysteine--tRNA ligase [Bacteroidales bacterium]HRZ48250.1 cysteine--tRNA ligase [Bacteroidales bacterium]
MDIRLTVYNTLTRTKEAFNPANPPFVGMYVCGPTVYGEAHLGHARPAITFDLVFRYLQHLGYRVRYVRNVTDVGHLENDADEGEDKIAKKARIEQTEPMEIAQRYTNSYRETMRMLNVLPPSIEPLASGHIPEQIEYVQRIFDAGFAYETNGSVYFDVETYSRRYPYGILSGRKTDELQGSNRQLDGQDEKRSPFDFALWKKAAPEHIMRWKSPWSDGFPGWHMECSAMGNKYLGETFDIHGGGMDLLFPHHEAEIAQAVAATGKQPVRYWLHNNMITINGQKMGKSLGNFITLTEFFTGNHPSLQQAYDPMVIRFFILQAHYRSTLDFTNEALQAAGKGLKRLLEGYQTLKSLKPNGKATFDAIELESLCHEAMSDDFNSSMAIAHLFDGLRYINQVKDGITTIDHDTLAKLQELYHTFLFTILGLAEPATDNKGVLDAVIQALIHIRNEARKNKDFATSDRLRDELAAAGIVLKDLKEGTVWVME